MNNKAFWVGLLALFLLSGTLLTRRLLQTFSTDFDGFSKLAKVNTVLSQALEGTFKPPQQTAKAIQTTPQPISQPVMSSLPTPKPVTTPLATLNPTATPVIRTQTTQPTALCHRFTVPHLDGSSSTKCYSQNDYNQLTSLYNNYMTATSNYNFELRVKTMYENAQTVAHDPSFYQPSIDKAAKKAQEYQNQIGQIALQMYNIESRGY